MSAPIFTPVSHSKTADDVCSQIETLILEGVLRVGDRLPSERELSEQLQVSRPVLRDALKDLEGRGLLETRHGGGTVIADIIGDVFSKTMLELISTHPKATSDYLEYRREVEGIAAYYAAQRATGHDRAILTDIIERMKAAHSKADFREEAALDVEFHQAICESAHNILLLHTLRSCYRLLANGAFFSRSLVYSHPGARDVLLGQHIDLYEAVTTGDPDAARACAEAHMRFVEECTQIAEKARGWETISALRHSQRETS
ncbi:MAG: FadR/GntR family transcriptional regulator [Pseudomonadota bacterium]